MVLVASVQPMNASVQSMNEQITKTIYEKTRFPKITLKI